MQGNTNTFNTGSLPILFNNKKVKSIELKCNKKMAEPKLVLSNHSRSMSFVEGSNRDALFYNTNSNNAYAFGMYKYDGFKQEFYKICDSIPKYNSSSYCGAMIYFKGELHIMGGNFSDGINTKHQKIKDGKIIDVSTLPMSITTSSLFYADCSIANEIYANTPYRCSNKVLIFATSNEIHLVGSSANGKAHYIFNGNNWIDTGGLPDDVVTNNYYCFVIFKDELHMIGRTKHYKYSNSQWVDVCDTAFSNLLYDTTCNNIICTDNEIYLLGNRTSTSSNAYICVFNGTSWSARVSTSFDSYTYTLLKLNNKIYIITLVSSNSTRPKLYRIDYSSPNSFSFPLIGTLSSTYTVSYFYPISHGGKIHLIGGRYDSTYYYTHYTYDGESFIEEPGIPNYFQKIFICGNYLCGISSTYGASTGTFNYLFTYYKGIWNTKGLPWSVCTERSGQPYCNAIEHRNEIHIFGCYRGWSSYTINHDKFNNIHIKLDENENKWEYVSTCPAKNVFIYKDELYALSSSTPLYKFNDNDNTWSKITDAPNSYLYDGSRPIEYKDNIHFIEAYYSSGGIKFHYIFDGEIWTDLNDLPDYNFYGSSKAVINGLLYSVNGGQNLSSYTNHTFVYDGRSWSDNMYDVNRQTKNELFAKTDGHYASCFANNKLYMVGHTYRSIIDSANYTYEEYNKIYEFDGLVYKELYTSIFSLYGAIPVARSNGDLFVFGGMNPANTSWLENRNGYIHTEDDVNNMYISKIEV